MVEFTGSGYLDRAITTQYQNWFEKGARLTSKGQSDDGNTTPNLIAKSFKSHCIVKVTNASTIKSLPCSKETDPNSKDVESVKVGDEYEAIALHRNTTKTGNLWYEVKTKSGGTGYLFAGNTKFVKQLTDDVTVKNPVSPASIDKGKSFIIGGTISSSCQTITRVQAWVTSPGGLTDYLYGHHDNLSVTSYNLAGSAVDTMLTFGTLDVGVYQYRVRVRVDSYYAKDATTTATVYNDELYLEDCESIFFVLDTSCSHSYNVTVKEPTCIEGGYTTYTCTLCGYTYNDYYTEPHVYASSVRHPTCTEGGYTTYTCTLCGYAYNDNYTDPLEHAYASLTYKPTCTEPGYTEHSCWRCGYDWISDAVDPTGHWYTLEEIPATCTEPIKLRYTCITCGYFYEEIIASYTSEWSTEYPDVDDSAIIESKTEYRYRYWIDSSASWTEWSDWGDSYDPSAWVEERAVYRYLLVEYAFHDFEFTIIVPGTCTTSMLTVKTCVNCGMSYEVEFPATGHIYEGTMTIPYTCGTDGLGTYVCTRDGCGDSYTVVFPATGDHTYDDDYDAYCNTCGGIREVPDKPPVTPDLPADAPAFVVESVTACEGEEITVAIRTQRNSGIVSLRLEVAYDADVLELISLEEGDFANVVLSPTTRNPFIANWADAVNPNNTTDGIIVLATFRVKEGAPLGKTEITLTYDSEDVYDQNFDNVGFRVENGYVEVVDYVVGDVNEDGRINNKDLGLLQQYLAGFEVSVNQRAADVNADSRVNNKDLGLLQQYLAGFEVELG
ncbi:MAG: hypothetical protein IKL13_01135 [Clostridia bacterium]|nr:hypothetical protein [Clostridia bacterium]